MLISLLDRFADDGESSFARDLAALLNTRRRERDIDPAFEQATNSVLTFGVVDFTAYNLNSSVDQEKVRRSIERAIRQFEPRIARAVVSIEQSQPFQPVLNLHLEAELEFGDNTEIVVIEGTLDRASRRVSIKDVR